MGRGEEDFSYAWMNSDVVRCECLFPNDHPTAEYQGKALDIPLQHPSYGPALKAECSQTGGTLTWYIMGADQSPRVNTERGAPLPHEVRSYADAKASVTIKKVQELSADPPDPTPVPEAAAVNTQAATDSAADDTGDAVKQASDKSATADAALEAARKKVGAVRAGATGEDEVEAATVRANYLTKMPEKLQNFNDQCFLLEYASKILTALKPGDTIEFDAFGPPTRSLLYLPCAGGGKYGPQNKTCYDTNIKYISHITMPPGAALKNFFEITPDQTAQIVPFIEISINIFDSDGKLKNSIALDFDNKTDLEAAVFKARGERNLAGIKNVTINLDGIDTATSRLVTVNASFVFQDFRTIFRPKKDVKEGGRTVRRHYSDLFSYDVRTRDAEGAYKKLNFKIGWSAASTLAGDAKLGLAQQMLRLDVQIVKYTFDFQMDGSVMANIIYKGLLETALDGPESNVLSLVKETMSEMNAHKRQALQEATETRRQRAITSIREDTLRNLGTLLYKEKLLGALSKFPGGRPGFGVQMTPATSPDAPLYIKNAKTMEQQLGERGRLIWVPAVGDQSIGLGLDAPALQGQLNSLPGEINVDADEMSIIARQVKKLWTGRWSTSAKGMTKDEFDKYLGELNNDRVHEDVLARKNKRTMEKNLLKAHVYAQEAVLQQQAAVKFQGLWQLAISLLSQQHIYYIKLTGRQKFKLNENLYDQGAITQVFNELKAAEIVKPPRTGATPAQYVTEAELNAGYAQLIPFVFLGDFLKALLGLPADLAKSTTVLELIKKVFNEDFKVDLGYIYYSSPFSGGANDNFPLYYLPLSLVKLNNFFTRNIVGKELTFYSFRNFVQDLLQEFLVVAHQNCRLTGQSARVVMPRLDFLFGQTLETRHHFISEQSYKERWGMTDTTYTKMFKSPRQHSIWFIYGAQSSFNEIPANEGAEKAFGSYPYNVKNNIFHFYLGGQNKGIIKSVKLIDNTNPDLKTAIYLKTQSGNATNLDGKSMGILPPLVYKVEIETLGCALFHMGNLIFLDARQFIETNIDRIFKISGYYRIYKVTHNSSRDGFTTTVTAILEESYDEFKNRAKSGKTGIDASSTVDGPSSGGAATILGPESAINEDLEAAIDKLVQRMQKFKRSGDAHGPGVDTQLQGWIDMIKTGKYPCVKTVAAQTVAVGSGDRGTSTGTIVVTKKVAEECTATFAKMAQTTVALSNQSHARATVSYEALIESWNTWKRYDCEAAQSAGESDVNCERNKKDYLASAVNALGTLMEKHGMRKDWTGKPTQFLTLLETTWKKDILMWKLGAGLEDTLDANIDKVKVALSNLIAAQKGLKEAEAKAKAAKEDLATKQKEASDKEGAALKEKCQNNPSDPACIGVYTDEYGVFHPEMILVD